MAPEVRLVLRPASLKVHSVVYKGETKQGQQLSIYVPWDVLREIMALPEERHAGTESLSEIEVTFKEA